MVIWLVVFSEVFIHIHNVCDARLTALLVIGFNISWLCFTRGLTIIWYFALLVTLTAVCSLIGWCTTPISSSLKCLVVCCMFTTVTLDGYFGRLPTNGPGRWMACMEDLLPRLIFIMDCMAKLPCRICLHQYRWKNEGSYSKSCPRLYKGSWSCVGKVSKEAPHDW